MKIGDAAKVETLLQQGADPNRGGGGLVGGTPVTWAIRKSDFKILSVVIQYGAKLNQVDNGATPLDEAAMVYADNIREHKDTRDSIQVIKLLKHSGATRRVLDTQPALPSNL